MNAVILERNDVLVQKFTEALERVSVVPARTTTPNSRGIVEEYDDDEGDEQFYDSRSELTWRADGGCGEEEDAVAPSPPVLTSAPASGADAEPVDANDCEVAKANGYLASPLPPADSGATTLNSSRVRFQGGSGSLMSSVRESDSDETSDDGSDGETTVGPETTVETSVEVDEEERRAAFLRDADTFYPAPRKDENEAVLAKLLREAEDTKAVGGAAHCDVMWRIARCYMKKLDFPGFTEKGSEPRIDAIERGMAAAKDALDAWDESSDAHKYMAVALGRHIETASTTDKIKQGFVIKEHMERAIALRRNVPEDAFLFYMNGLWCWEVASLSWGMRQLASRLFAEPPKSTFDEALSNFLKAEEMNPNFYNMCTLHIGKTYAKLGQKTKAREWFNKCANIPIVAGIHEEEALTEATELLRKM